MTAAFPTPLTPAAALLTDDDLLPVRVSRFYEEEDLYATYEEMMRLHLGDLRTWAHGRDGSWRRHVVVDVGRPVGKVLDRATRAYTEVSTAVVVMVLLGPDGPGRLYEAYPEIPLDPMYRERFPMLPHLFGAYFGDLPQGTASAHLALQQETYGRGREQMREQLADLLRLDDDELARAVDAFGSHLRPSALRKWVEAIAAGLEPDQGMVELSSTFSES